MQIIVESILFNSNGNGAVRVLFKVVRHREYKKMMATIFYSGDEHVLELDTCIDVVNLESLGDILDPDYFRLVHKAAAQWYKSWDYSKACYAQKFPFIVSQ